MNIFYITFAWNRNYLYDGYIIAYDNKIIGYTDDSILAGDHNEIIEVTQGSMIEYDISLVPGDSHYSMYKGENYLSIMIREVYHKTEEQIISRIKNNLQYFPPSIQQSFIENYLTEE